MKVIKKRKINEKNNTNMYSKENIYISNFSVIA